LTAGSLTVVGTGIELAVHVTPQALAEIQRADDVPYLVADAATGAWLRSLTPRARSLKHLYQPTAHRAVSYEAIVDELLSRVRAGLRVCAAFYGHPGVFVQPSHEAIRRARAEGFEARMLPAVSAEDCLFADLGVDPGRTGCQSYEATDFLVHERRIDPTAALVLWQVGGVGDRGYPPEATPEHLQVLVDTLLASYPADHEVVLYEASPYPVCPPFVSRLSLAELPTASVPMLATLYVAPAAPPRRDLAAMRSLGLSDYN
jgi:uncharacterized protein YabN with tetrapyrrole methylase and pyrophosphatase domain